MPSMASPLQLPLYSTCGKIPSLTAPKAISIRRFVLKVKSSETTKCTANDNDNAVFHTNSRRDFLGLTLGVSTLFIHSFDAANGAGLPPEEKPKLCDDTCEKELENVPMVTTESGLQYKDIIVGQGPSPPVGFQVAANYVAMVPSGQIFDSSLEKGQLYIFRVGSGQLAFPKGLNSAPGRPRVAPNSPVVFDVSLEYVPGLEVDDE